MTTAANFKQIDIERAIRGARNAGEVIYEIIASKEGVRLVTHPAAAKTKPVANAWDEVFDDGAQG